MHTDNIAGILVNLDVGGRQALFLMLGADGSVNRSGDGSASNQETDLFIGKTTPRLFEEVRKTISPELLKWCGQSLKDPESVGQDCSLKIGFKKPNGEEKIMHWIYGSESLGPPPEVQDFVRAAVFVTDEWYRQQKIMAIINAVPNESKAWWQFWK